jgi:lipoprotein-releasing system ATP-binding protein
MPALELRNVVRSFPQGDGELTVLKGISLSLKPGEIVALVGPSGAGKSTLLHIAGLLERPSSGDVKVAGQETTTLNDSKRTSLRRQVLGFVYQFHHLLPEFSALENVVLPQLIASLSMQKAEKRAKDLLGRVGLSERLQHRPSQLSGGEQQRVAIVRALANQPTILLADEPTGNLDSQTSEVVFAELMHLVREHDIAALIATHNPALAARMDRTLTLVDGKFIT